MNDRPPNDDMFLGFAAIIVVVFFVAALQIGGDAFPDPGYDLLP
jgi:hypothetical protein